MMIPLFGNYDPGAAYTYGRFGPMLGARKNLKTSGSSTTVTAVTADDGPLDEVDVGSLISVNRDGTWDNVYLTAKASADSGTVSGAGVNWDRTGGRHFYFRRFLSGTGANDGAIGIDGYERRAVHVQVSTLASTSVVVTIQWRPQAYGAEWTTLFEDTLAATVSSSINSQAPYVIQEASGEIRVGWKANGNASGDVVAAYFVGERAR